MLHLRTSLCPLMCVALIAATAVGCGHDETTTHCPGPTPTAGIPELSQNFAKLPDGNVPATAESGHVWTQTASRPAAEPAVVGGRFTNLDMQSGRSANYLTAQLCGSATYIEAEFEFGSSGSTDGENVTLIASSKGFPGGDNGVGIPPDAAMHLALTPTGWIWSYVSDGSANLTELKSVSYAGYQPGTSRQRVTIKIDRANSTATSTGAGQHGAAEVPRRPHDRFDRVSVCDVRGLLQRRRHRPACDGRGRRSRLA